MLCLFSVLFMSCKNEDQKRIPDVPVYFEVNFLTSYPTFRNSQNDTIVITKPVRTVDRIGYGGLLIYSDFFGNYCAFDLCCPNEVNPTVRIFPDETGHASCKVCGSVYDISSGFGNRISGPSAWSLKRYKAQVYGDILYISN